MVIDRIICQVRCRKSTNYNLFNILLTFVNVHLQQEKVIPYIPTLTLSMRVLFYSQNEQIFTIFCDCSTKCLETYQVYFLSSPELLVEESNRIFY